jgi:carbon-monoxide dehydrogenase medium subunit
VKPSPLRLARPRSLAEALALLAEHGDDAKVLAGGQSLMPVINFRLAAPAVLVELGQVPALALIEIAEGAVRVGAMCPQRDLERHAEALAACPLLELALPYVGHVATRNRGTVGGSIAHADAAAELPLVLQTLAGAVEVTGPSGARLVPADQFFVSHLTSCLEPDELVTEVRFPVCGPGWGAGFAEVAPRHGDYAVCALACALRVADGVVTEARLGAGAVADRPMRLPAAEAILVGTRCEPEALAAAAELARAGVDPSDGMHASAEYRRHLTGVLAERCSQRAYAMAAAT